MAEKDGVYVPSAWVKEHECGVVKKVSVHERVCTMRKGHDPMAGHRDSFGWWKNS